MDIKQAAKTLGVSTGTIRNWIKAGRLSATTRIEHARMKYEIPDQQVIALTEARDGARNGARDGAHAASTEPPAADKGEGHAEGLVEAHVDGNADGSAADIGTVDVDGPAAPLSSFRFAPIPLRLSLEVEEDDSPVVVEDASPEANDRSAEARQDRSAEAQQVQEWLSTAVKNGINAAFVEVSERLHKHIHHQYELLESVRIELANVLTEVCSTRAEVAATQDLTRHIYDTTQRDRDQMVVRTLQNSLERGRHRKRKQPWW
ncbi:helix-turn-helix domain-containing protein [Alicyclobacillus cycloheptanicus]|uniref:Excisionase family DNA binding protein n=1 Tax=Alicyclobacillus cycloheptanicus TaxID=1457 RepID=A0ABT9XHP1_9BACL|nr:helix-turn-helix domain-containing protein [Alicyclobacillus cycloheptanicus]MDQ0189835.1 excisionase family DNA binding protein [Alicyclobacillus cycloheptanicus]WDM02478.1 helix-turn-helix domain-containing protein [Alicyclobacillus cycloheptanicus]